MKDWFDRCLRDFGFWSLQCVISGLPGFCIAMWLLGFSEHFHAFLAMLSALFTMILVVTALMSIWPSLTAWRTLPSRGLRLGLILRAICAGASLMVIAAVLATNGRNGNPILIALPDIWTGLGAVLSMALLSELFGFGDPATKVYYGHAELGFAMIYLISVIDGLILCFLIFIVSFVSMLVLQIRDRKKFYQGGVAYGLQHRFSKVDRLEIPLGSGKDESLVVAGLVSSHDRVMIPPDDRGGVRSDPG